MGRMILAVGSSGREIKLISPSDQDGPDLQDLTPGGPGGRVDQCGDLAKPSKVTAGLAFEMA